MNNIITRIVNSRYWGIIRVTRLNTALIIGLIVFIPWTIYSGDAYSAIIMAFPFLFVSMGAFAFNDVHDIEKDKLSKPHRPLPRGIITVDTVKRIGVICYSLYVFSCYFAVNSLLNLLIYAITFVGCVSYNLVLRKVAILKVFITALVSSMPIILVVTAFKGMIYLPLVIAAMFFILARELLMDIRDMKADSANSMITIPIRIGERKAFITALFLFAFAFLMLLPVVFTQYSTLRFLLLILVAITTFISIRLWINDTCYTRRVAIMVLWIPMLLSLSITI